MGLCLGCEVVFRSLRLLVMMLCLGCEVVRSLRLLVMR